MNPKFLTILVVVHFVAIYKIYFTSTRDSWSWWIGSAVAALLWWFVGKKIINLLDNVGNRPRRRAIQISAQILRDHLTCLGLPLDKQPTRSEVITAHRQMALQEHPDRYPPEEREQQDEKMKLINQARDFLLLICIDRNGSVDQNSGS